MFESKENPVINQLLSQYQENDEHHIEVPDELYKTDKQVLLYVISELLKSVK